MNLNKYFIKIILIILLLKIVLLFWSAHPYDFWTFVTTIQKNTLYNWNLFEHWNKGNFLMLLWYPMYALYLKIIELFSFRVDNLLLLHFFFKLPFLFIDLLSGFLIFRIILKLTNDKNKAQLAFLFWWLNPIIYYVYGIHGHYELLVPFSIILLTNGLLDKKSWIIASALVIGFTTKYFLIILTPFVIIYMLSKKQYKIFIYTFILFIIGLIISYIHFIISPDLLGQTFESILKLSKANAPLGEDLLTLPPLNLVSAINYLFNPNFPISNLNSEFLFNLANQGIKLVVILLVFHLLFRIYSIYINQKNYEIETFLKDLFLVNIYFLILLTNFQSHYLSWLIPFFIIFMFLDQFLFSAFIGYTTIGFIHSFRSELGVKTFFLDILPHFNPIALNSRLNGIIYLEGSLIILLLIFSAIGLLFGRNPNKIKSENNFPIYFGISSILWILLIGPFLQAIPLYLSQESHPDKLAFSGSIYHRGIIFGNYKISKISNDTILFNDYNIQSSLILNELQELSMEEKNNFQASILIKNLNHFENIRNILSKSKFNECSIEGFQKNIFNYFNKYYYGGFKIEINCIKKTNNNINANNFAKFTDNDIELYISNKKVNYLYIQSNKNIINIAAFFGGIYSLIFISYSFLIIKKFQNNSQTFQLDINE